MWHGSILHRNEDKEHAYTTARVVFSLTSSSSHVIRPTTCPLGCEASRLFGYLAIVLNDGR